MGCNGGQGEAILRVFAQYYARAKPRTAGDRSIMDRDHFTRVLFVLNMHARCGPFFDNTGKPLRIHAHAKR